MLALFALIPMFFCAPHGGQYIPPVSDAENPTVLDGVVAQPGLGPELAFSPSRWEWWFDFNQEPLLDLRRRMPARARLSGSGSYEPLTADDRTSVVLPALVAALRKRPPPVGEIRREINNRDVRGAAVLAMGRLALPEAVPYIQVIVESDPDLFVRTQGVLALGYSASPQAVEGLVALYRDTAESEEIRTYAAVGLALVGNGQAVDTLLASLSEKALKGMTNQLRAATIYAAGISGQPSLAVALRALGDSFLFGQDPTVRALTAVALGRLDDPSSVPFLLQLLGDPDNQVRRSVAVALQASSARLDAASVATMIAHYRKDSDQLTRLNLLRALGSARLPESRAFLHETLQTATYEYRPHIAMALALDGDASNVAPLLVALEAEKDLSTLSAFAVSLGLLQAGEATPPLLKLFETQNDPTTLGYLCLALGLIDPSQPELSTRIASIASTSHDIEEVRSAIIALGLLGARSQLDTLAAGVPAVKSSVERATQLHGLGLVGDRKTLKSLLAMLSDELQPIYVRTYTLQALGELSDPRELSPNWKLSSNVEMSHEVGFLFELYRVL